MKKCHRALVFALAAAMLATTAGVPAYAAQEEPAVEAAALNTDELPMDLARSTDPVEDFVKRFYKQILGREADPAGLEAWTNNLKSGKEAGAAVGAGFIESDEFKKRNLGDEEYIRILYRAFFDREADQGGLEGWINVCAQGLTRRQVYRGFAESNEFGALCGRFNIVRGTVPMYAYRDQNENVTKFVYRCYSLCLNRTPDEQGLEGWCRSILTGENSAKKAAYGFIYSEEFKSRNLSNSEYVKVLYRLFLDREADPGGLQAWTDELDKRSRLHVFNGFADSDEFRRLCDEYRIYSGSGENVEQNPIIKSSYIGYKDGVFYTCVRDVDGMQRLPFGPHRYSYISNFAFYNGRVYYSCKTPGTSDFRNALISCNMDGSDPIVYVDSASEFTGRFSIANGNIYYALSPSIKGTAHCVNIATGAQSTIRNRDLGAAIYSEDLYSENEAYGMYKSSFYRRVEDNGNTGRQYLVRRGDNNFFGTVYYSRALAVVGNQVYLTGFHDDCGDLYRYDMNDDVLYLIGTHRTAGGGDPYFNY